MCNFETPATLDDLVEWLKEGDYNSTSYFSGPEYLSAIVGITEEGRLVYHYDLMAQSLAEEEGLEIEDAYDFIDYNALRTIPYMGECSPIVIMPLNGV